jgi:heme-degrading monooxygenase HmoA
LFVRIWRFRAAAGREREFEQLNDSSGAWAQLFRVASGYLGTELQRVVGSPREYLTIDRWESRDAWLAFRQQHAAAYESLDHQAEPLTESEVLVREADEPLPNEELKPPAS